MKKDKISSLKKFKKQSACQVFFYLYNVTGYINM